MIMEESNPNSQTNWTITSGTLPNCLTFQSSLSFSDEDESTVTESHPLLLHSPSPDSTPCEITINFAEKHEVRQIYIRSTARVYEIYIASDLKSSNEYLCTVRCGVAVREGEVLRSRCGNDVDSLSDENVRSEDDWVDVKAVDANSHAKPYINLTNIAQDLYEATAEINDVNPCISVTLRLLSLQTKGSVCVDEIYVFGDPVGSEIQESSNENSSSSSLMAMLLPTLMQVSKTTGLSSLNDVRKDKQFVLEDDLKETPHPSGSVIENQLKGKNSITDPHEIELKEVKGSSVSPAQPETLSETAKMESDHLAMPSQTAQMDNNCKATPSKVTETDNHFRAVPSQGEFSGGNVERALEKLMSRMDRIEEICLGFQEKMVMPMNSIEARLQRVEQQLETLSMKWQNPKPPSCYRISAPDASFIESDTDSCEDCLDFSVLGEIESDKKSLHTEVLNGFPQDDSPQDMSDSEHTTQLLPGLVVTAPEFSEGEDEDDNASEQEMSPSNDKAKLSIDDALSSALANFLSSSLSSEFTKHTKSLHVKAPEFSNEDDDQESNSEPVNSDSVGKCIPFQVPSFDKGEKVKNDSNDKNCEETAEEAEQRDLFCKAQGDRDEVCVDRTSAEPSLRIEDNTNGKITGEENDVILSNISNIPNKDVDSQNPSDYREEAPKNTFHDHIIENVLGYSLSSPVVDFEIPLLDVKFVSHTSPITDSFLESFLVETPETSSKDPSVEESIGDISIDDQVAKFLECETPETNSESGDLSAKEYLENLSIPDIFEVLENETLETIDSFFECNFGKIIETSSRHLSVKENNEDLSIKDQQKDNSDLSIEEHSNLISVNKFEPVNPSSNTPQFALVEDLSTTLMEPVNIEGGALAEDHKRKRDPSDRSPDTVHRP
ncbi:uncharacterized protein LOC131601618 [Vicia villosa]|uniref:uncharacterized protein LOC131601618 n=1 Tax=Vicia villosa TaxID=3911 RepID=UPI00273B31BC|nr:uncharacterized protein LOC131601618 [Vicia villosa]